MVVEILSGRKMYPEWILLFFCNLQESFWRHSCTSCGRRCMMTLRRNSYIAIVLAVVLLTVGATIAATDSSERTTQVTVPESTPIHVMLNTAVSSNGNRPGDHFEATVSEPVVIDGKTIIPEGAPATGVVVDARHSGRLMGRAHLQLALETVGVNGSNYNIRTASSTRIGGKHKNRNLAWIGGGAGGGLLIGALAGGGEGALIGGPIGAGAGTTVALITGKKDIHLRAETPVTFKLARPATIDVGS
jgi:hypothetical protein